MKMKMLILMLLLMCALFGYSKEKTVRVAAVQLNCKVGELDANLTKAEKLIRQAFEQKAELVVLPEFFTTPAVGFPYTDKILEAICPLNGKPMQLLKKLSQEYNGIVGGSFVAFHGKDTYNSFVLAFPDGEVFVHNKDYPTTSENCYYTGGTDDGVFETPIGNIGAALCWEYIRTGTAKRLLDRVDIVIGGSCWPVPTDPVTDPDNDSLALLKPVPAQFARLLGVPVVHTNHVGKVEYPSHEDPSKNNTRYFLGVTQIVDGHGKIIKKLDYKDGEGIIMADVVLGKVDGPTEPIPDRFWIPELSEEAQKRWKDALTGPYRKYYEETTLPYCLKKWPKENP
ncbi:MAG: carbon-nitrogen hydrolase family protein [Candidatus Aminicenantes bacterium]|nr:carbon-nitrogen hydrolase family protein [Candidatus Aminicenantes bacterium]